LGRRSRRRGRSARCGGLKLMRKLSKNYAVVPVKLVADDLRSYIMGCRRSLEPPRARSMANNRAENSHRPAAACQNPNRLPLELACILTTLPIRSLKRADHRCPPFRGRAHIAKGSPASRSLPALNAARRSQPEALKANTSRPRF
jgi:hypothetical protein